MSDLLEYFKEEAYEAFLMEDLAKTYNDVLENQTAIFEAMDSYVKLIELEEEFSKLTEATEINLDTLNDQLGKLKDIFTTNSLGADLYKSTLEEAQKFLEEKVSKDETIMKEAKRSTEDILISMCSDIGVIPIINWM